MLKVEDLVVSYGGIEALKGISLNVPDGKIITLIGANGAGKSTLLRTIIGLVKPQSGKISYNEKEITGLLLARCGVRDAEKFCAKGSRRHGQGRQGRRHLRILQFGL